MRKKLWKCFNVHLMFVRCFLELYARDKSVNNCVHGRGLRTMRERPGSHEALDGAEVVPSKLRGLGFTVLAHALAQIGRHDLLADLRTEARPAAGRDDAAEIPR
ncbi:unnamed protein product [Prorocentrum cordatum]|uniref:Uncharacterized protein n=1 Tax=Prorocentrum cordatum TaxID=2364126 RepID=A0ABN9TI62_9DINO|nr:unnamed protein product [Polarella glacialis]